MGLYIMSTIYGENGLANKIDLRYLYNIIYILSHPIYKHSTKPTQKKNVLCYCSEP